MTTVLRRSLVWGGVFAAVLLVVAGLIGWFAGGGAPGLWGAVIAVAAATLFLGITTASMLVAAPISRRRGDPVVFFAIVGGAWLLKLVLFLVLLIALRAAEWLQPAVFGITLVVAVVGLLAIDVIVMVRTRVPIIDEPEKNFDES